MQLRKRWVKR